MTAASPTPEQDVVAAIRQQVGNAVEDVKVDRKDRVSVVTSKETMVEVAAWLQRAGLDHAITVSGVDRPRENQLDVVYFLSSYSREDIKGLVVSLKIHLDRERPSLPSLTPIWESANLFERETHEMFGVAFEGHPNLSRLLLQDNWEGPPPLRKDLKIPELA
jgi:NADH-quinone oxidoreductase subunit C